MKALRSRYARCVLVPVMAVTVLSACSTWKVERLAPAQVVTEKQPDRVRLTTANRGRITLVNPWTADDAILGHPPHGRHALKSDTLRVPTYSVTRVEINNSDVARTLVAVALVVTVGHIIITSIAKSIKGPFDGCCG